MENTEPKITLDDDLARMMANGFAEVHDQFATLENHIGDLDKRVLSIERGLDGLKYKVDQLDQKLDQHRQETKDGFDAMRRVMGSMSRTQSDHEERVRALVGE